MAGKMRKENIRNEMHLKNEEKITHRNTGLICTKNRENMFFLEIPMKNVGKILLYFSFS